MVPASAPLSPRRHKWSKWYRQPAGKNAFWLDEGERMHKIRWLKVCEAHCDVECDKERVRYTPPKDKLAAARNPKGGK